MLASQVKVARRQVIGDTPAVLTGVLDDSVNLAVWHRQLPVHVAGFAERLLALGESFGESLTLTTEPDRDAQPTVIAAAYQDLAGHAEFVADVAWLVRAFACLVGARRVGLRLRALDKAMCPRFHVDHVPLRLITTYVGVASQWLKEGAMSRQHLGDAHAEPQRPEHVEQLATGAVALFKGEKWIGNEGTGIIHRSPQPAPGERRLILTLDWLG
jgi:hypothetical protein